MIDRPRPDALRDGGFTLVEMIVVVVLMGLVTAAIAFSAMIVLRTNEYNNDGMNVAAVERSLTAWLSRDLASVPGGNLPIPPTATSAGFSLDNAAAVCSAGPPNRHLVSVMWHTRRSSGATRSFAVDYRIIDGETVDDRPTLRVQRFACERDAGGWSTPEVVRLGGLLDVDQPTTMATANGTMITIDLNLLRERTAATPQRITVKFAPLGVK